MKFSDIPQRIQGGSWECNYGIARLPEIIADWQKTGGLQLNPDFQRGHVWSEAQQVAFVEYLLSGGRSGLILYFNNPSWQGSPRTDYNDFVCVDGLQRLTALCRFVQGEIPAFGHYVNEYEDLTRLRTQHDVKININGLQTKAEVLTWYLQMNAGGTPHTAEEIERVRQLLAAEKKPNY